jgi:hypothetical protein
MAIFASDQSHQGPPFLAPPMSAVVMGPLSRTCSRILSTLSGRSCQRYFLSRKYLRLKAYRGQSSIGRMQAA